MPVDWVIYLRADLDFLASHPPITLMASMGPGRIWIPDVMASGMDFGEFVWLFLAFFEGSSSSSSSRSGSSSRSQVAAAAAIVGVGTTVGVGMEQNANILNSKARN